MARFLKTGRRDLTVLDLSREEMAHLIRDLTNQLVFQNGAAPSVEVYRRGSPLLRILFQASKRISESDITLPEEDLEPVFLKGLFEEDV